MRGSSRVHGLGGSKNYGSGSSRRLKLPPKSRNRCLKEDHYFQNYKMNDQQDVSIQSLPEEILQKIIFLLPNSDLKSAILVCRRWHGIGMEPKLWTNFRLCINYKNVGMIKKLLGSKRLSLMRSIRFVSWFVPVRTSYDVIKEISNHGEVDDLIIRGLQYRDNFLNENVSYVDENILVTCINKMKKVTLSKTFLMVDQKEILLKKIRISDLIIE